MEEKEDKNEAVKMEVDGEIPAGRVVGCKVDVRVERGPPLTSRCDHGVPGRWPATVFIFGNDDWRFEWSLVVFHLSMAVPARHRWKWRLG